MSNRFKAEKPCCEICDSQSKDILRRVARIRISDSVVHSGSPLIRALMAHCVVLRAEYLIGDQVFQYDIASAHLPLTSNVCSSELYEVSVVDVKDEGIYLEFVKQGEGPPVITSERGRVMRNIEATEKLVLERQDDSFADVSKRVLNFQTKPEPEPEPESEPEQDERRKHLARADLDKLMKIITSASPAASGIDTALRSIAQTAHEDAATENFISQLQATFSSNMINQGTPEPQTVDDAQLLVAVTPFGNHHALHRRIAALALACGPFGDRLRVRMEETNPARFYVSRHPHANCNISGPMSAPSAFRHLTDAINIHRAFYDYNTRPFGTGKDSAAWLRDMALGYGLRPMEVPMRLDVMCRMATIVVAETPATQPLEAAVRNSMHRMIHRLLALLPQTAFGQAGRLRGDQLEQEIYMTMLHRALLTHVVNDRTVDNERIRDVFNLSITSGEGQFIDQIRSWIHS